MKRSLLVLVLAFVMLTIVLGVREWRLQPDHRTHISFLDVGQGDSALIVTPSGRTVIIDGGPDWSTLEGIGSSLPFFHRTIDVLILSHANLDHFASFPEILTRYRVTTLYVSIDTVQSPWFLKILHSAEQSHTTVKTIRHGDTIALDTDCMIDVLWPPKRIDPSLVKELNNTSLVLRLHDKQQSALFTGDMESIVEEALLRAGIPLQSDILKVAHHGSKTSSTDAFLRAVHPKIAVISVGKDNTYGHPNADVIRRLTAVGAEVRRTDEEGEVDVKW